MMPLGGGGGLRAQLIEFAGPNSFVNYGNQIG
jgi:hypothetical protein